MRRRGISWGRVVALVGLLAASGCFWRMPGGTPDRQGANAFETTIGPTNVAGLTLAWSAATDGGPVGDPVTSLAGVHVTDPHAAYGFDREGGRLWASVSPEPLRVEEPHVQGADTVLVGRWNPTATASTDPTGSDETLRLDAATGEPVAAPRGGVAIAARGDRVLYSSIRHVRFGQFGQYPFWLIELALEGTSCCSLWYGVTDGAATSTPEEPDEFTVGPTTMFQSGDGPLSASDPSVSGNGLRAFAIAAPATCYGAYVCANWTVALDGTAATRPVLADSEAAVYVGTDAGTVYAVDTASRQVLWSRSVGSAVVDSPALAGGSLFVPTSGGGLVVLDAATGAPAWSAGEGTVVSQPAVAGGVVYAASAGGILAAYDAAGCGAATCTPLWSTDVGAEVTGGPSVDGGQVYVGTADARLAAYRLG